MMWQLVVVFKTEHSDMKIFEATALMEKLLFGEHALEILPTDVTIDVAAINEILPEDVGI